MDICKLSCVKVVACLFLAYTAAAFQAAVRAKTGHIGALRMSYSDEIGVLPPTGFWDPLGLAKNCDEATFRRRREVELKHGRVAMLAVTGYIVAEIARFPGAIDLQGTAFHDIPNGVAAITAIPAFGWFQIAASIGYWEIFGWESRRASDQAGDFNFGTEFFGKKIEGEQLRDYRTKELQNGRLAMLAIMELLTHDVAKPVGESLFAIHHF